MSEVPESAFVWGPRVLGILTAGFIGLFALDAFTPGKPLAESLPDFLLHLAPALVLLLVVAVSWHRAWLGGVIFIALAAVYAVMAAPRFDWILAISGPLVFVGLLFLWSWRHQRQTWSGTR